MKEAEPHNMGFYLFIRETLDTLALFSSQGKLGKGVPNPLYTPDFCIALLGIAPRFSRDVPLVTTTRLCLMKAEPHNMGFYLFIQGDFGHPCPIFLSGKIGQGGPKNPLYTPDFCIALLGDRPEILSGRPLSNYNKAMSHEEAEPHNMGFYLFIRGDFGHPCPIFLSGKIGQSVQIPSIPRFLHSLVRGSPRDSLRTSLVTHNKAMSHEKGRTAQHGFLPLHSRTDFGHPCPIFLSGKIGQG